MPDQLLSMRAFMLVVETQSFSLAARELGISQVMVSKHVAALEKRLGVTLLERRTRPIVASEAGRRYLKLSRRVLEDITSVEDQIKDLGTRFGLIRLYLEAPLASLLASPVLYAYLRQNPGVDVRIMLHDAGSHKRADHDVILGLASPAGTYTREGTEIGLVPTVLCASPQYLAQNGTPTTIEELERHPLLPISERSFGHETFVWRFADRDLTVKRNRLTSNGHFELMQACWEGLGIAYLPLVVASHGLASGALKKLPIPDEQLLPCRLYLSHAPVEQLSSCVQDFLAYYAAAIPARLEALLDVASWISRGESRLQYRKLIDAGTNQAN